MRTRTFTLYIAATPERVWQALTEPTLTRRYYLGLAVESTWQPGTPILFHARRGPINDVLYGEIVHAVPHLLLIHSLLAARCWLTWEITETQPGLTRVALAVDDLEPDPDPERDEAWSRVVSGLKTVLETGAPLIS
ncbi:SRPBCC domain-containing protein [Dactylosporangium sp. CS-047395]|uniref:SRPBCC domain-containing protein n=1 Tax=Dactylosporangium sp. CS-047395 TaxID=3239936 RepID=UPI003D94E2DC